MIRHRSVSKGYPRWWPFILWLAVTFAALAAVFPSVLFAAPARAAVASRPAAKPAQAPKAKKATVTTSAPQWCERDAFGRCKP